MLSVPWGSPFYIHQTFVYSYSGSVIHLVLNIYSLKYVVVKSHFLSETNFSVLENNKLSMCNTRFFLYKKHAERVQPQCFLKYY